MTPAEVAARLTDRLVADRLPYAVGGALALIAWDVPAEAKGVDLFVFAAPDDLVRVLDSIEEAGAALDRSVARRDFARAGWFSARCADVAVAVTMAYHPVHQDMEERRVPLAVGDDKPRWFLSPEDLAISKLVAGDPTELDRLFAVRGEKLEPAYIRDWLQRVLGPADPRHAQLASLLEGRSPSP
jgi:hypothetical protein